MKLEESKAQSSFIAERAIDHVHYIRREALVAIPINAVLGAAIFTVFFGTQQVSATAFAIDFWPQSLGTVFIGTIVPSILAYRRAAASGGSPWRQLARHIGLMTVVAIGLALTLGSAAALTAYLLAPSTFGFLPALCAKAIYGGLVGWLATPPVLRFALIGSAWGR